MEKEKAIISTIKPLAIKNLFYFFMYHDGVNHGMSPAQTSSTLVVPLYAEEKAREE